MSTTKHRYNMCNEFGFESNLGFLVCFGRYYLPSKHRHGDLLSHRFEHTSKTVKMLNTNYLTSILILTFLQEDILLSLTIRTRMQL